MVSPGLPSYPSQGDVQTLGVSDGLRNRGCTHGQMVMSPGASALSFSPKKKWSSRLKKKTIELTSSFIFYELLLAYVQLRLMRLVCRIRQARIEVCC